MIVRIFLLKSWNDDRGTSAVEFAVVGPAFIALIVGMLYSCWCLFALGSLHYAVEQGARCASVRTAVCSDAGTTVAYAKKQYFGPNVPTFTYAAAACGNSVSGSLNYSAQLGVTQVSIPLSATACFP